MVARSPDACAIARPNARRSARGSPAGSKPRPITLPSILSRTPIASRPSMATSARGSDSEGRLPSSSQTRACNQALVPWSIAGGAAVARLEISMENRKSRRTLPAKSDNPHVRERRFSVSRIGVRGLKWRGVPVMRSMRSRLVSKRGRVRLRALPRFWHGAESSVQQPKIRRIHHARSPAVPIFGSSSQTRPTDRPHLPRHVLRSRQKTLSCVLMGIPLWVKWRSQAPSQHRPVLAGRACVCMWS